MKPAMGTTTRSNMPANPGCKLLQQAIDVALEEVSATPPISDEGIHDARKALKKAR